MSLAPHQALRNFAPLECENFLFSLETLKEENKVLLRGSIICDQTTDTCKSVLENQFLTILFAFGHLPRVLIFEVFIHAIHSSVDGCINGSINLSVMMENSKEFSSLIAVNVLIASVQLSIKRTVLQI